MKRSKKEIGKKVGAPPGTLIYTGDKREEFEITAIDYNASGYRKIKVKDIDECASFKDPSTVTWIDVVGLHRVDAVEKIGKIYNLHPLVLEDILNIHQRSKIEYFEDYIFIVLKMLNYDDKSHEIESEQVSMVLGDSFVFTFRERKLDIFDPIRERIENDKGAIRKRGADYLLHALIDIIVDHYYIILEKLGEEIEGLESEVITNPSQDTVQAIHKFKSNLITMRRSAWPLREVLSQLSKGDSHLITEALIYFRDVYDHTIQAIDTVEMFRDMTSSLLDIYLSSISNKTNEIMKVLTIIATIFIPLTLIAGIYGMNFKYMPELEWRYGYPMVLIAMLVIGIGMVVYFKRKKWM